METLRNAQGSVIGSLRESGGQIVLFSKTGTRLGHYDPKTNTTFNATGSVVARCNILTSLIKF